MPQGLLETRQGCWCVCRHLGQHGKRRPSIRTCVHRCRETNRLKSNKRKHADTGRGRYGSTKPKYAAGKVCGRRAACSHKSTLRDCVVVSDKKYDESPFPVNVHPNVYRANHLFSVRGLEDTSAASEHTSETRLVGSRRDRRPPTTPNTLVRDYTRKHTRTINDQQRANGIGVWFQPLCTREHTNNNEHRLPKLRREISPTNASTTVAFTRCSESRCNAGRVASSA